MIPNILVGAVGGAAWAILGTVKTLTNKDNEEDFSTQKFVKSVVIGGIIGGAMGYNGQIVDTSTLESFAIQSSLYAPVVAVVDKVLGFVWNLVQKAKG